jgi:hypothetical protein
MTETQTKWATRVAEWRQSGKSAEEFAEGRGFEGSTLRYWSSRLKQEAGATAGEAPPVRIARVVRRTRTSEVAAPSVSGIVVEIGRARVTVQQGFDRSLLRDVIALLHGDR